MTGIERIKDDLKKISKWPWEAQSDNETTISAVTGELLTSTDAEFALKSPERIALLVEYYEAAEKIWELAGISWNFKESNNEWGRLRQARAKLKAQDE